MDLHTMYKHHILPINCTARTKTGIAPEPKFKAKCGACSGYSYSQRNVRFCNWCESSVHFKCWKENLGCIFSFRRFIRLSVMHGLFMLKW